MKKTILLVISLMFLFSSASFAAEKIDEVDGFRGIKWGTSVEEAQKTKDLEQIWANKPSYSIKGDELKIGEATLESIVYEFWQDKLMAVMITTQGYTNFQSLKAASFEKFGPGRQRNQFLDDYYWRGEISGAGLVYNEINKEGTLVIMSTVIYMQKLAADGDAAKKGASTDF